MGEKSFVLKTYKRPYDERYFENESKALKFLTCQGDPLPGMIGYYGTFLYNSTRNILLERTDKGTLEQFLMSQDHPQTAVEILAFWKSILNIVDVLQRLHGGESERSLTSSKRSTFLG